MTHRKHITIILALLVLGLLVQLIPVTGAASEQSNGLDVLIMLDNSYSLTGNKPTDKNGFRYDAVASFISMLDAENTRANYALYNQRVNIYTDGAITPIKSSGELGLKDVSLSLGKANRTQMLNELTAANQVRGKRGSGDTNIALALETAVDVLLRENNGNKKVIIIFADSGNKITYNNNKVSAFQREKDLNELTEKTKAAKEKAEENGITIHAVLLNDASAVDYMQNEVKTSDGTFSMAAEASDLPDIFARIFAHETRNQIQAANGSAKADASISIPVPQNHSADLNILIPLDHVGPESFSVITPEGETIDETNERLNIVKSNYFAIYKIIAPQKGEWKVFYTGDNSDNQITAQYILNYDLSLTANTSASKIHKDDQLTINASYLDKGSPITDPDIYTIPASITIKKDEKSILSGKMTGTETGYTYTIDSLKKYGSGNYSATIHCEGSGLNVDCDQINFTVVNREPELKKDIASDRSHTFNINMPGIESSFEIQTYSWELKNNFTDPDEDPLTYTIKSAPDFIEATIEGSILTISTKPNTSGIGDVIVTAIDEDQSASPDLIYNIEVKSAVEALDTIVYADKRTISKKDDNATVKVQYTENGTTFTTGDYYKLKATATLKKDGKILKSGIEIPYNEDGYIYTFDNLRQYGAGVFTIEIRIQSGSFIMDCKPLTIELNNELPKLTKTDRINCFFRINDPVDDSSYEIQKKEYQLETYIEDPDDDPLTWSVKSNDADVDAEIDGSTLTISTKKNKSSEGDVIIGVTDPDGGQGPELTFHVTVKSIEETTGIIVDVPVKPVQKHIPITVTAKYTQDGQTVSKEASINNIPMELDVIKDDERILKNLAMNLEDGTYTYVLDKLKEFGSGSYSVIVHAETEHFKKESETVTFILENADPIKATGIENMLTHKFNINIPGDTDSYQEQTWTIDLSKLIIDQNEEPLTWNIKSQNADINTEIKDSTLTVSTRENTVTEGDITVYAADTEGGQSPDLTFHIMVESVEDQTGISVEVPTKPIQKHLPVTIIARYNQFGKTAAKEDLINSIPMKLDIIKDGEKILRNIPMNLEDGIYTYELNQLKPYGPGEYAVVIHAESGAFKKESETASFTLINDIPVKKTGTDDMLYHKFNINIPGDSESYREQIWQVDLTKIIIDQNGDELTWEIISNNADVDADLKESVMTITTKKDTVTEGDIVVSVSDSDNAKGPDLTFHIIVESVEANTEIDVEVPVKPLPKHMPVTVTARYVQFGKPAGKESLVNSIPMRLDVIKNDEKIRRNLEMTPEENGYTYVLDNLIAYGAGDYSVIVHAEDENFRKESEAVHFSLVNAAPVMNQGTQELLNHTFNINIPGDARSYQEQIWTIDLNTIVSDPNGDTPVWKIESNNADVKARIDGSVLTVTTKVNTPTSGHIIVSVEDTDGAAGPELDFRIDVVSIEKVYEQYSARITPIQPAKNSDAEIKVTVYDEAGEKVINDAYLPDEIKAHITFGDTEKKITLTRQENGTYSGSFHTEQNETDYSIDAKVSVGEMTIASDPIKFATRDKAPVITKELTETVNGTFYPVITKDLIVNLDEYFTDPDGDKLTYKARNNEEEKFATVTIDGNQMIIHPAEGKFISPADYTFSVEASDEEGGSIVSNPITITVHPIILQILMGLLALLILVLIILFIRWKNAHFGNMAYDVSYGYKGLELPDGLSEPLPYGSHKAASLGNSFTALARNAVKESITSDSIGKITVKPLAGNKVRIQVPEGLGVHVYQGEVNHYDISNQRYTGDKEIEKTKTQRIGDSITISHDDCRVSFRLVEIRKIGEQKNGK